MESIELNWVLLGILLGFLGSMISWSLKKEKQKVASQPRFVSVENFISYEIEEKLKKENLSEKTKDSLKKVLIILKKYKIEEIIETMDSSEEKNKFISSVEKLDESIK